MQQRNCRTFPPAVTLSGEAPIIEPPATPTPHTAWCQPQNCAAHPGLESTHRHLIGQVAGVEVWVERPDTTRTDGTHDYGTPAVHVFSEGILPMSCDDLNTLRSLTVAAEVFADEIAQVR